MNTAKIVERVLSGEVDAYVHIVRQYQSEVWRVVAWTMQDTTATEDLVQQAFVNAYLNLNTYTQGADFGVWLRTIARNLVRNELRRRGREDQRMRRYNQWLLQRLENLEEAEVRDRELHLTLQDCRATLAPTAARALTMRYDEGLPFAQIAEELGRTVEASRQMLARVRAALRRCMDNNATQRSDR